MHSPIQGARLFVKLQLEALADAVEDVPAIKDLEADLVAPFHGLDLLFQVIDSPLTTSHSFFEAVVLLSFHRITFIFFDAVLVQLDSAIKLCLFMRAVLLDVVWQ